MRVARFTLRVMVNPKTGNGVLDIGKLYTDTVDYLDQAKYALDGCIVQVVKLTRLHFAIVSASSQTTSISN